MFVKNLGDESWEKKFERDTRSKRIDFGHSLSHDARRIVGINRDDSVVNEIW